MADELTLLTAGISAVVAIVVALITSSISAWVAFALQEKKLRTELKLEFAAETAIQELLSDERWKLRTFEAIQNRFHGFKENELRRLLIQSGAVSFRGEDGVLWGLRKRNLDRL